MKNLARVLTIATTFVAVSVFSMDDNQACSELAANPSVHVQVLIRNGCKKPQGVNLGGWLVPERWMSNDAPMWQEVSSQVGNTGAYSTIMNSSNPDLTRAKMNDHFATFITEDDIAQIAAAGLSLVRVPVGHWIMGYHNHDPSNQQQWAVYPSGSIMYLDRLIRDWAKKYNVAVLVDIHAAKGSQNGQDHSSPESPGQALWSVYPENVANTIDLVTFLADRYMNDVAFLGLGLLNEPSSPTNETVLYQYYTDAYHAVRSMGSDCLLSIAPMLQMQNASALVNFMTEPDFYNVCVEWHPYFVWGLDDKTDEYVVEVAVKQEYVERVAKYNMIENHNPLYVGEWSFTSHSFMRVNNPVLFYQFAQAQINAHNAAEGGWSYWAWRATGDGNRDLSLSTAIVTCLPGHYRECWRTTNLLK